VKALLLDSLAICWGIGWVDVINCRSNAWSGALSDVFEVCRSGWAGECNLGGAVVWFSGQKRSCVVWCDFDSTEE
jgi:hypothetical protein